ncbi:DUF3768 domain-containing protein [Novosphingobium sp. MD-1]|uniref:DUF3768 domain-containing protein n=1 Tax=Novosphingobium sp. MD-1 TaxID=1630648 RepID=UPI00061C4094|nr:DUF3768 domain-containing protein [Novosphingobium sp. MD-1]GAO52917.1 hypothetical protein NMD1_00884 [Novosphingobium sp. MD-1]
MLTIAPPAGAPTRLEQIAHLNDRARLGLDRTARIVVTRNCLATLGPIEGPVAMLNQARLMAAARSCTFSADSPERDLGVFAIDGHTVWVKIDSYDRNLEYGSDDPADPVLTTRVVTILLPEDW